MEFSEDLIQLFDILKFTKVNNTYVGKGQNYKNKSDITFYMYGKYIVCRDSVEKLFTVINTVKVGTFLCILQEFGIVHERYIYESIDYIKEQFLENE